MNAQPKPVPVGHPAHRPPLTDCADRADHLRRFLAPLDPNEPPPTPIATRGPDPAAAHDCPTRTCLCGVVLGGRR